MLAMFLHMQFFAALFALSIDNEGSGLAAYSPFFVSIIAVYGCGDCDFHSLRIFVEGQEVAEVSTVRGT
jgi:hypothetical protein